jgi:hypothetical protein
VLRFLLVVILVAIAVYLTVRVIQRRGIAPPSRRARPKPPPRVMGPDDDPDFLRDLDRKRKRKHPERPEDPEA